MGSHSFATSNRATSGRLHLPAQLFSCEKLPNRAGSIRKRIRSKLQNMSANVDTEQGPRHAKLGGDAALPDTTRRESETVWRWVAHGVPWQQLRADDRKVVGPFCQLHRRYHQVPRFQEPAPGRRMDCRREERVSSTSCAPCPQDHCGRLHVQPRHRAHRTLPHDGAPVWLDLFGVQLQPKSDGPHRHHGQGVQVHPHVPLRRPFRLWRQSVRSWVETNNKTQHGIHVDILGITFHFFQGSLSVKKTRKDKIL